MHEKWKIRMAVTGALGWGNEEMLLKGADLQLYANKSGSQMHSTVNIGSSIVS